jgi:nucleoside-diphosphate-sugar epimerase
MKALITGGAGFLGRHVVAEFLKHGAFVWALDNFEPHCGGDGSSPEYTIDVAHYAAVEATIADLKPDTIIHLAAYGRNLSCQDFPQRAWEVNVDGTHNVLEIARLNPDIVKRVVVCSSNITLSDVATTYKMTKLIDERLIELYAEMGVSVMGLRPSNICGTGQSRTEYQPCAMAGMDIGFAKNGHFSITGDGTQARDFVNAKDVARAFWLAATSDAKGFTVDVCTGKLTSLNEIVQILGVPVKYVDPRPGDAKVLISDPGPAKEVLGFSAEIDIVQTLADSFPTVMEQKCRSTPSSS